MSNYSSIQSFYTSKEWQTLRQTVIAQNISDHNGILVCDHCGKPILGEKSCHVHHVKHLTNENFDDPDIALNPDNVQCLHHDCHNKVHNRFGGSTTHRVVLVYGSPCAGKIAYVKSIANHDDLIISTDLLFECLSNSSLYANPYTVSDIVQRTKSSLLGMVKTRTGRWQTAYIVDSMPSKAKRNEFCRIYGATTHLVESTEEECLERRKEEGRQEVFDGYIHKWWREYKPD